MATKKVLFSKQSIPETEGAGVKLHRVFSNYESAILDPFLLLDDFSSDDPKDYLAGFPWHPHRGIETVTYMLSGKVEHEDSLGNKGIIGPGEVQWMTAGSGIIHQEMPKKSKKLSGLQLWVNLPRKQKMCEPKYRGIDSDEIPSIKEDGNTINVISGKYKSKIGPVTGLAVDVLYLDIAMASDSGFGLKVMPGYTNFIYLFQGEIIVSGKTYTKGTIIIFDNPGDTIEITSAANSRYILLSGKPNKEPIAWAGPIVMNTQEELRIAFEEYRNGTFIKHKKIKNS